jgi:hypothetical protein
VKKRPDVTRRGELHEFLTWLSGKNSQSEATDTVTGRSLRRKTAWCWDVEPTLIPSHEIHHEVLVDGIWVGTWCLLIAVTKDLKVLAWQWCARESTAAWTALLEQVAAPAVIVSDGGSGIAAAVRACWPETKTQRCLFHIQMNVRRHLTLRPRTHAGRTLLGLSRTLSAVHDIDQAIQWELTLNAWWQRHGHLTKERTRDGHKSWFTHETLRKAWLVLANVTQNGTLFTFVTYGNARTTSPLEGGINNGIRHVLRAHRGMSETHMKRAAEWFLFLHDNTIEDAYKLIPAQKKEPIKATVESDEDEDFPQLYGTELTAEEGLWSRSGWAGRA